LTHDLDAEFTALVRRHARFVFRVAYAVLLNGHDAEDAAQETFLKLFRNHGWREVENELAFLARVAWRVAVDLRAQRRPSTAIEDVANGAANDLASPGPTPEQAVLADDRQARVHALINALPEELRVPLVLSAFEELNSRQIGEALSIPEGTVRTRLMRARQLLREKLAGLKETHYA
jgi:RNA polymerase sigma-70 factor, ECF subfamily